MKAKLIIAPNPILQQVCDAVAGGEDVTDKVKAMFKVLGQEKYGVGLAAPQVGFTDRIIIFQNSFGIFEALVNPHIGIESGYEEIQEEGCLSYPGITKRISRPVEIDVQYQNQNGKKMALRKFTGFQARIICHEIDHLDGKCKVGE
jgi:peptide deformylase